MYSHLRQRYDFKRVSAIKLDKNTTDPSDVSVKYDLHPDRMRQIPLQAVKEHPDFITTSKATYRPFIDEEKQKTLNSHLFQPDYAHNDNTVRFV